MEKNKSIWQKEIMERFQSKYSIEAVCVKEEDIIITKPGEKRTISWHPSLYEKLQNSFLTNQPFFVYTIMVEESERKMYIAEFSEGETRYLFVIMKIDGESLYEMYKKKKNEEHFRKVLVKLVTKEHLQHLNEKMDAFQNAYQTLQENRLRHLFSEKNR